MEFSKLLPFILMIVAVGILIGISIVVTEKIGLAGKRSEVDVVNDSILAVNGTAVALTHGNITSFTQIINASSDVLASGNYTVDTTTGDVTFAMDAPNSTCGWGKTCYATYEYTEYNTPTNTAMSSVTSEASGISTNWLGIIVIVVIAAIILGLVMQNFQKRR